MARKPSRWQMPSGTLPCISVRLPKDTLLRRKRSQPASTRTGSRWESFYDIVQSVKLAQNQDLAGFSKLAAETRNPDIRRMLEDLTPTELMETMKKSDGRQLEQMLREGETYLESVGHERYWQEILPARLRREMAVLRLQDAVLEASADGPYAEVPPWRGWPTIRERSRE